MARSFDENGEQCGRLARGGQLMFLINAAGLTLLKKKLG
jgi:hypothetical protein